MHFAKFLRTLFFIEHLRWLFLVLEFAISSPNKGEGGLRRGKRKYKAQFWCVFIVNFEHFTFFVSASIDDF